MAQTQQYADDLKVMDPEDIGWWIESVDERKYGPVSRATLRRFLEEGNISPNTLVRHCTHPASRPVVDQPGIASGLNLGDDVPVTGDRIPEVWPRRWRAQAALAEDAIPCSRHKRPAVGICLRCHASYCNKCRAKPYWKAFFLCRKCQASNYNRRTVAYLIDGFVFNGTPYIIGIMTIAAGMPFPVYYVLLLGGAVLFLMRDWLFTGAGPGKRFQGLRVVGTADGKTPLTLGQAVLRWLSLAIPFFNLVDLSVPYRDRFLRRYGDRWAGTRVIDTESSLQKARGRAEDRLARKGVTLAPPPALTMNQFAQLA